MSWRDARHTLAEALRALTIDTGDLPKDEITKVYETPPSKPVDTPCIVFFPPAVDVTRNTGRRRKLYTLRLRTLVADADLETATDQVDAYREALIDALDSEITLGQNVTASQDQRVEEAAMFEYMGNAYAGFDVLMTINITEGRTFA